ncbi:MAG: hypothetical protein ACKOW9_06285 [Candidatus Paceibacterota bacterium]
MNNKRVSLLIMSVALIIALLAPLFIFSERTFNAKPEGYQRLEAISRSLSGDRRYDLSAAEALKQVETVVEGEIYRSGEAPRCWELNLKLSMKPYSISC